MRIHHRKTSKDLKSIRICLHEGKNNGLNQSTFLFIVHLRVRHNPGHI